MPVCPNFLRLNIFLTLLTQSCEVSPLGLSMTMNPKGPLKKPKQQVQVDLKQADTIKCNDCNNYLFITSVCRRHNQLT